MVDVDRRLAGLTLANAAGLRRLYARAASAPGCAPSLRSLADDVLSRLRSSGTLLHPGVTDEEFAVSEAEFGFVFPPDLRAVLSSGLPAGAAFPDWRCSSSAPAKLILRASLELPAASVSLQVARNGLWPRSWGPKPHDPAEALTKARARLKRAPPLVPIGNRYYIPSRPCVAGNPVFYVDEDWVVQCGKDLADLFDHVSMFGKSASSRIPDESFELRDQLSSTRKSLDSSRRQPRWIEFWSDMATTVDEQRKKSSPERFFEMVQTPKTQHWVDDYVEGIASVLKEGGWREEDVREMTEVLGSHWYPQGELDRRVVLDMFLLKADRIAETMRNAGWSADDVSDMLEPCLRPEHEQRLVRRLPPRLAERFEKLADWVSP
ncbi:hypothetical protein MLD38_028580 [Melastoma candidum]|uniref:Uncharacterized protein n=1 Tax=Melastoma candidum TaxID=119954 RepID=A0ACB9N171_9MYRT|nr:hypothetical protein MLD38_028580 [Melastoma candidum]